MSSLLCLATQFVPVSGTETGSVNGLALLVAAYAVIVGGLLAYGVGLTVRSRSLSRKARAVAASCALR